MSELAETGPVARQLAHAAQDVEMAAHLARPEGGDHSAAFAALAITAVRAWAAELDQARDERTRIGQVYTGLEALADLVQELASATEHLDLSPSAPGPDAGELQAWNRVEPTVTALYEELEAARERAEQMNEAFQDRES